MLSEECSIVISGLLMGLNVIDYSVSVKGEEFDKPVRDRQGGRGRIYVCVGMYKCGVLHKSLIANLLLHN